MIKTTAIVTANSDGYVSVSCQQKSACGHCSSKKQCGVGITSSAFASKTFTIEVPSATSFAIGSEVEIGLEEKALLSTALLVYILPLAFIFIGAYLGQWLADNLMKGEGLVILSSFIFGVIGIGSARYLSTKLEQNSRVVPMILRLIPPPASDKFD